MRNKTEVPLLDGPKKDLIIHHGDMDGVLAKMIAQQWIESHFKYDSIECLGVSYDRINPLYEDYLNIIDEYRYIFIVDISINEELAKSAPSNVFIFDHHDTSRYLEEMSDNFYWSEKYCGACVTWAALMKKKPVGTFKELLRLVNNYDMWLGPDGQPAQISHDLNLMFWKLGFDSWHARFLNGFDGFTKNELRYIENYWINQGKLWKETSKFNFGKEVVFFMISDDDLDANWWSNRLLREKGVNVAIAWRPNKDRLSMRANDDYIPWFHCGEWLQENISNTNNSKGGHKLAGGCSTDGMSPDDIIDIGKNIKQLIDERNANG
jgi:oligoribonuclease NrnB/cAMP/cGMP phosphodiesterase (DHH superfamily)